jgi:hypothetical protein
VERFKQTHRAQTEFVRRECERMKINHEGQEGHEEFLAFVTFVSFVV